MKKLFNLFLVCIISVCAHAQNLPDVTAEFDKITSSTKSRFERLKDKWPITEQMFMKDINYLLSKNKEIDKIFDLYYGNLSTWSNLKARIDYIIGHFKSNAPGDIKATSLKKYTEVNAGRVIYKNKIYTVEQLGNINFGIACKAIGLPYLVSACGAGLYQVYADQLIKKTSKESTLFLASVKKAVNNNKIQSICFDNPGDSKMIKTGYGWY